MTPFQEFLMQNFIILIKPKYSKIVDKLPILFDWQLLTLPVRFLFFSHLINFIYCPSLFIYISGASLTIIHFSNTSITLPLGILYFPTVITIVLFTSYILQMMVIGADENSHGLIWLRLKSWVKLLRF